MASMLPVVAVTRRLPDPAMKRLHEAAIEVRLWPQATPPPSGELLGLVAGCSGLLCLLTDRIDAALLDAAGSSLRVVSQMAVGVDNIDLAACTTRGLPVGHTPGVLTEATADLTLALMLAAARRLVAAANDVVAGKWVTWDPLGSASLPTRLRMASMAVDNLLAGLSGERLPHCANPAVYQASSARR